MKIYKEIIQQTPDWYEVRKLKMTASHASSIIAGGKGLNTYINNLIESYCIPDTDGYTSEDMERGVLLEDQARTLYELENNVTVEQVGFIQLDDFAGVSPDGLVNEDGLIEIKNHKNSVFIDLLINDKIDKKYLDQIQMQLYVTKRSWCDYVGYNVNIKPYRYIKRIFPDPDTFKALEKGLETGRKLIQKYLKIAGD